MIQNVSLLSMHYVSAILMVSWIVVDSCSFKVPLLLGKWGIFSFTVGSCASYIYNILFHNMLYLMKNLKRKCHSVVFILRFVKCALIELPEMKFLFFF